MDASQAVIAVVSPAVQLTVKAVPKRVEAENAQHAKVFVRDALVSVIVLAWTPVRAHRTLSNACKSIREDDDMGSFSLFSHFKS